MGNAGFLHYGKNVAGFSSFRTRSCICFYQSVFLKDEAGVLIHAQEGATKGLRQWRFTSIQEIREHREKIRAYLMEAPETRNRAKR